MRREQIHKICLNHLLAPDVEYTPKDSKSWQFVANDYSELEFHADLFCLRFKTEEIAIEFKKAVDDIRAKNTTKLNGGTADHTPISSNVTNEERKNITDLKLPGNFYDYKSHEACSGCRGCTDDYVLTEVKDTNFGQIDDNPLPLIPPPKVETLHNDLSKETKKSGEPNPFSFGSFKTDGNGFSFGTATSANNSQQSGMLFGNSSFNTVFGGDNKDSNKSSPQTNLFGGSAIKTESVESAEYVKSTPSFSFNNSSVFGTSGMLMWKLFPVEIMINMRQMITN